MNTLRLLLLSLMLSLPTIIFSQHITYDYPNYLIDGKFIEKSVVTHLLLTKEKSSILVKGSESSYKSAKNWGIATAVIGLGAIVLTATRDNKNYERLIVGILSVPAILVPGIVALLQDEQGTNRYKKAIKVYNDELSYNSHDPSLHFGLTNNGLGIVYSF